MSNQSWPSPPTGGSMPPPPPSPAAPPYTAWATPPPPPPGDAAVATPPQSTSGLRTATTVLFWVTVGSSGAYALTALKRASVWDDSSSTYRDLQDADDLVALGSALMFMAMLASTIVASLWALRAGRRAVALGAHDVSPGLACGSWYIPVAWLIVPFIQVRRMARAHRRSVVPIGWWQGLFIAGWLAVATARGMVTDDVLQDTDDIAGQLQLEGSIAVVATLLLAGAAFFAMSGLRNADGA